MKTKTPIQDAEEFKLGRDIEREMILRLIGEEYDKLENVPARVYVWDFIKIIKRRLRTSKRGQK